jgi:NFU1 iron-sulfur cluster scaffold homolog, mitochondrial
VDDQVTVDAESTPNPNSYKFTVNRQVTSGRGQTFRGVEEALLSPLAQRLFELRGVRSLFFLKDFITVGRAPETDWDILIPDVERVIRGHFEAEKPPTG